jgi:hypothetical protein
MACRAAARGLPCPLPTILQLLGYALMDFTDRYAIDTVGMYLSRAGALIVWPLEDYLTLLAPQVGPGQIELDVAASAGRDVQGFGGCIWYRGTGLPSKHGAEAEHDGVG